MTNGTSKKETERRLLAAVIPALAVAMVVSAAFACMAADGSDADSTDYQKSVYVKLSGLSKDQFDSLGYDCVGMNDIYALESVFDWSIISDSDLVYEGKNICVEDGVSSTLSGTTETHTTVFKVSAEDLTFTRTVTEVPDTVYATDGEGDGFAAIMNYLGDEPFAAGTVIKCTCSSYSVSFIESTKTVYKQSGDHYIFSEYTDVCGISIQGVFSYTIGVGDTAKTFDITLNYQDYYDVTYTYSYLSDEPAIGDMYQMHVTVNKIVSDTSVTVKIDGTEYALSGNPGSDYKESEYTSSDGTWGYFSESMEKDKMDDAPEYHYDQDFSGLTGDDEKDAKTISDMGGTSSLNNVSDVDSLANSVKDGISVSDSSKTLLYIIAVVAIIVVVILLLLFWKPGLLIKDKSTCTEPDKEVKG